MIAEPVTANAYPAGGIPVIRNAYVTLAGLALDRRGEWVHCAVCGGKSSWLHCSTCHQEPEYVVSARDGKSYAKPADHGSCFACGRCRPPRARGRYCSTTCRVRAHNFYRNTPAGRAKVAEDEVRQAAFREAAFRVLGRATPEQIRRRTAARYGRTCGACGVELADGEPIVRSARGSYSRCLTCGPDLDATEWGIPRWLGPLPCEGCTRPVYFRPYEARSRRAPPGVYVRWVVCSTRCYQDVKHREQKAKRDAGRDPIDCIACGERVDARRRDARYCSPSCRQKAYRGRAAS